MKKGLATTTAAVLLMAGIWVGPVSAATLTDYLKEKNIDVSVSATMDYYSKYVWRGILLDDDNVFQPGVEVSLGNFTAGFWASWDIESEDSLSSDEVDGYVDYSFDLGKFSEKLEGIGMSLGHTWYTFPAADLNAQEYYVGLSLDTFLSPSITYYRDYSDEGSGGADGEYYIANIGHGVSLSEEYGVSLDLGGEVGFNKGYFIVGDGGYSLTTIGVSAPLSDNTTISASASYSIPFGDLKDDNDGNYDNELYYGVGLAFGF